MRVGDAEADDAGIVGGRQHRSPVAKVDVSGETSGFLSLCRGCRGLAFTNMDVVRVAGRRSRTPPLSAPAPGQASGEQVVLQAEGPTE